MVPKEFETSKEGGTGRSGRPAGPLLRADMANRGFSSYWGFLLGIFSCKYTSFPPCDGVVCVGHVGSVLDVKQ